MDQKLAERRAQVEQSFQEIKNKKEGLENQIIELDTELVKLQGEHRLILLLQEKSEPDPKAENVSKEANKIDIKEADDATKHDA